jgi:carbonic anhydrase
VRIFAYATRCGAACSDPRLRLEPRRIARLGVHDQCVYPDGQSRQRQEANVTTVDIIYRYEAGDAPKRPLPPDSHAALLRLNDGNRDFAALLDHIKDTSGVIEQIIAVDPRDLGLVPGSESIPKQRPFAAVLGCSDARVPIELIFNEGPNDLFVIRVAGNGLGTEVLGSLKYAVEHLGGTLKLIVVLGHSGCGALTTAVDIFLNPGEYLTLATKHSLRSILDRSLLVVQASANKLFAAFGSDVVRNPGYRQALIEASIATNAALAAHSIQQEFEASERTEIRAVYGVYLLETREVWAPRLGNAEGIGLAAAPYDLAGFADLGNAVIHSDRIASYLKLEE